MTTIGYAVCFLTIFLLKAYGADQKTINEKDADEYLEKYGYLAGGGAQRSPLAKTRAVKSFQEFAHLPVTGKLDGPTKKAMLAPRCGVVDVQKKTRSGFASRWEKPVLYWALEVETPQIHSGSIRRAIMQAFEVWSNVIPMNFTELAPGSGADMTFGFASGDHGDGSYFDGRGGILAHAFFPKDGRLHFDDDEMWAFEDGAKIRQGYTDLLSVTIHELGHALGLPHSNYEEAIMYPFYRQPEIGPNGSLKQFELSAIDIYDITNIYGRRENNVRTTVAPGPTPPGPSNCPRFDAAVTGFDGATYFFTNQDSGWTKAWVNDPPSSAKKFSVSQVFPGGPSSGITAGVTDRDSQLTFLFQGRRVFGYSWKASTKSFTLEAGFPKDLPSDISFVPEGAFQTKESHVILFKGDEFVIWDSVWNKATFKGSLKGYYPTLPANSKVTFADGQDTLYIVNGDNVSVYDFRSVISTRLFKSVIYC